MFLRMLVKAAMLRRGRAMSALLAMIVASAVSTAMLNLYADLQAKLRREFRNYGANIAVIAKDGSSLGSDALPKAESALGGLGLAVPFAYVVARTSEGKSVVVAGTDMQQARKLNSWWSVTEWPAASNDALVGVRASDVVGPEGKPFTLSFQERAIQVKPVGKLRTGGSEDSRVYIGLDDFEKWTKLQASTIEIAMSGSSEKISAMTARLTQAIPEADVRPIRQVMEAEARVLDKTRATLFAAAALIILTSALCVLATLMGWVFDRRRDFAIMKALGGSARLINGFFAAEAIALGGAGAVIGFAAGLGLAAWIGRVNFHASVVPRFGVFPVVLAGCVAVALISAALPINLLRRIQPAIILRGE